MSPTKKTCGVLSCKNAYVHGPDNNNLVFHSFPNDEEVRKSWIIACRNPNITTKNEKCKRNFVCEKHFTNDCYPGKGTKNKRLKKGSKPTKYLATLTKNVYIGNEIVGKIVNGAMEEPAMEEPTMEERAMEEPAMEEPVTVQSKLFWLEFEGLKSLDFENNEPVEVCLKIITENIQIIQKETERYSLCTKNDEAHKMIDKQLTRNLLAAQVIPATGYWEENKKCILKTIYDCFFKLQTATHEEELSSEISLGPGTSKVKQKVNYINSFCFTLCCQGCLSTKVTASCLTATALAERKPFQMIAKGRPNLVRHPPK